MSKEDRRSRKARKKDAETRDGDGEPDSREGEGLDGPAETDALPSDPDAVLGLLAEVEPSAEGPAVTPDPDEAPSALDQEPVWRDSDRRPAPTEPIGAPLGAAPPSSTRRRSRRIEPDVMADPLDRPDPTRRQRRADKKRSKVLVAAATAGSSAPSADAGDRGPRRERRMRAFRFPAVLIVIALIAGAFVIERRITPPIAEVTTEQDLGRLMPTATPADAASSTWFCAGGTAEGEASSTPKDLGPVSPRATGAAVEIPAVEAQTPSTTTPGTTPGSPPGSTPGSTPGATPGTPRSAAPTPKVRIVAEESIAIANASERAQAVKVTVYPSDGTPVLRQFDVAGHTRLDLRLSDVVKAPYASALVESNGGLLSVEQSVQGPTGRSIGPCASSPSASWYFAAGSTKLGTREVFVAFNPFPANAVLDFSFQVEEEGGRQASRDSDKLKGQVVPANGVVAFDVTDIITVREQLSTVVRARGGEGRVVVARLLVSEGTTSQPKSLNQNLGAPAPMSTWLFADGPVFEPGVQTSYVVYNPGGAVADVAVSVQPDGQGIGLEVPPFDVKVRAGQFEVVSITNTRVPGNSGYWVSVQSRDGHAVVAERVVRSDPPASRPGVSYTLGSPLVANRWLLPAAGVAGETFGQVSIANVAETDPVTLTIRVDRNGTSEVIAVFDRVELGAGRRTVLDLSSLSATGSDPTALLSVEATGPVIVEQTFGFSDPSAVADGIAIPVRDGLALPPPDLFDRLGLALAPGSGPTLPVGTLPPVPPGSDPGNGSLVPLGPPGSDGVGPLDGGTLPSITGPDGQPETTTTTTPAPAAGADPGASTTTATLPADGAGPG